jgi:RNA recognition motif-containing protein
MSTKLFVGNLSYNVTEIQLKDMFAAHGEVTDVDLIMDRFNGRPRGFAFVTMETLPMAEAAIKALHGQNVDGRDLTVNVARPKEERPGGAGFHNRGPRSDYRDQA